jgi:predicted nuclease of predicted toxin-antitoxin system
VKALLDEHLSPQIALLLRDAGYDVVAVAERHELIGSRDSTILEVATSEGRAVVTNNVKDFRPIAVARLAQGRTHAGLILLPATRAQTRSASPALAKAIEKVLHDHPDGPQSSERWIGPLPSI